MGEKIAELVEIFLELYKNEPEENYDMDGAREYWRCLPHDELTAELATARERLARSKL